MSDDRYDPYEALNDLTSDEGFVPLEDPDEPAAPPPRSGFPPFLVGLILGVVLIAISLAAFSLLADDQGSAAPGATTTTTTTTTTAAGTSTTAAGDTTTTTSTTAPAATSTTVVDFEPIGDPLLVEDLALVVGGIGPLDFGMPATEVMGRLIATFGYPDSDSGIVTADGSYGACPGDEVRIVRWGLLATVITSPGLGGGLFDGYRVDLAYAELSHPTSQLATYSGISVGSPVQDLEDTYAQYTISYTVDSDPEIGQVFELLTGDGRLLLWGPLTSADPDSGVVRGIYAPDVCDR